MDEAIGVGDQQPPDVELQHSAVDVDAVTTGRLGAEALDVALLGEAPSLSREEVAKLAGVDVETVRRLWRARLRGFGRISTFRPRWAKKADGNGPG